MKTGDFVSVIDDRLKGKIISLKNNMAIIEDEHGFTHTIEKSQLVTYDNQLYDNITIAAKDKIKSRIKKNIQYSILDLHFEKLVHQPSEYEPWERLFLQKQALLDRIDFCRENNIKTLTIIHGIGDGILQNMVYEVLKSQINIEFDSDHFFYHQSGSTQIYFL